MTSTPRSPLTDKLIREVEAVINSRNREIQALYEELEIKEAEVVDARRTLHFLKTGEQIPAEPRITSVSELAPDEPEPLAESEPEPKPKPERKRRESHSQDEYRMAALTFASREFTTKDLAEKVGVPYKSANNMVRRSLLPSGFLVQVRPPQPMGTPNRQPAIFRLKRTH